MRMKTPLLTYLITAILLLSASLQVLAQGPPSVICQPNEGEYGLQFYIVGEGFKPNGVVQIESFDSPVIRKTDDEGRFRVITFAPTDKTAFPPGEYDIVVTDERERSAKCSFVLQEVKTPARPPVAPSAETPAPSPTPTLTPTLAPPPTPSAGTSQTLVIGLGAITALGLAVLAFVLFFVVARRKPAKAPPPSFIAPSRETGRAGQPKMEASSSPTLPRIRAAKDDSTLVVSSLPVLTTYATLSVVRGEGQGTQFVLDKKTTSIGRDDDCDIVIAEAVVSRHHAKVVRLGPEYCLYDLKSTNGTLVNGQRVDQRVLQNGDEIQIGVTVLLFERPSDSGERE